MGNTLDRKLDYFFRFKLNLKTNFMKSFDLEEAKKGKKLITRNGRPARIICYDRIDKKRHGHILALVCNEKKTWEMTVQYHPTGFQLDGDHSLDLFIDED